MVEEWQRKMQLEPSCQTICGEGFLKLLVELRVVILQDAVFLKQLTSDHEMFQHEIFQSEEFCSFAEELNRCINSTTPPSESKFNVLSLKSIQEYQIWHCKYNLCMEEVLSIP